MNKPHRSPLENADQAVETHICSARRLIEKLPEQTSLQRLNKIAASLELLTVALTINGLGDSRQSSLGNQADTRSAFETTATGLDYLIRDGVLTSPKVEAADGSRRIYKAVHRRLS